MEIRNLLDPAVKAEIVARIETLHPGSERRWGKMDVAQMLAHLQMPMGVALGTHSLRANPLLKLIMPLFKKALYDEKPWKQGLPTDKTFVKTSQSFDFETEKKKLLALIEQFTEEKLVNEKHPIFGRLSKEQWSRATWKHLDHHLKQFGA